MSPRPRSPRDVRDVRDVLLLHPYQLPIVAALAGVSIVFTIWPEALDHAPIAFEKRGILHHLWHYTLMGGALLTLWAMLVAHPARRVQAEVVGLLSLSAALALNLIALTAAEVADPNDSAASGLGLALRIAVLIAFWVRIYTLVRQPTVQVSIEPRREV